MKYFYFLLAFAFCISMTAQDQHCATDEIMKRIYEKNPALKLKKQQADEASRNNTFRPSSVASYTIPIVFHVLHLGGPENISDVQVKDAVRILNRDYDKKNPDTVEIISVFKNLASSTGIRFELATKDPSGNCTNGIIHHYDTDTDWDETSPTLFSHTWDPTKYLNVYVVRKITLMSGFGAAGYTFLPGTLLPGDPWDAIVVLNNYFGSVGTGSNFLSRVLTHEVGHWLNLHHVFGSTNSAGVDCSGDDFVNDTPPTIGYLDCLDPAVPAQYQTCTPGVSENYQNYMDYSYCNRMFTAGQALRMQQALNDPLVSRDNLWTNANLIFTGVINPTVPCVPIADFKYNRSKTCVGSPVQFTDASWSGQPTSYSWSFPGGTPATSTSSAPLVTYANTGLYSVVYTSSNAAGPSQPVTKVSIITVTSSAANYISPWTENFESLTTINQDWTIETSSGGAKWEQSSLAAYSGMYSAELDDVDNTRKTVTAMIGPIVDLSNNANPILTFKLAAAEIFTTHVNTLKVYASTNCGTSWSQVYGKTGQSLVTTSGNAPDFLPAHSDWRIETVNMAFLGGFPAVNFKFEYTRDTIRGANNVFIDDINISANTTGIQEQAMETIQAVSVYPVPTSGELTVSFHLASAQKVNLSLYDISGRWICQFPEQQFGPGEQKQTISVKDKVPAGIYFLKVEAGREQVTKKLIVAD